MHSNLLPCVSHVAGATTLGTMLTFRHQLAVPLVATDNPANTFIQRKKRIWRHGHRPKSLVPDIAKAHGIDVFDGRLASGEQTNPEILEKLTRDFNINGILTCVFGQRIRKDLLDAVNRRAYNIHPVMRGYTLAESKGARPIEAALLHDDRPQSMQFVIHVMEEEIDTGEIVARGEPCYLPQALQRLGREYSSQSLRPGSFKYGQYHTEMLRYWTLLSATLPALLTTWIPRLFTATKGVASHKKSHRLRQQAVA